VGLKSHIFAGITDWAVLGLALCGYELIDASGPAVNRHVWVIHLFSIGEFLDMENWGRRVLGCGSTRNAITNENIFIGNYLLASVKINILFDDSVLFQAFF
jgi:hypothetical protein